MNIDEVLVALREDYALRASLKRKNLNVQEELEDEIENLEQSYITSKVMPELKAWAENALKDLECEVTLSVVKKVDGTICLSNDCPQPSDPASEKKTDVPHSQIITATDASQAILITENNIVEAEGRDLRITIDGTVYQVKNSIQTFIAALKHIGLDRIPQVGITCSGYNLVDTRQRKDGTRKWQQEEDGKWIYIYFSNTTKVKYLFKIAEYLKETIRIEAV